MNEENVCENALALEGKITEKVDRDGTRWWKAYAGGGAHADNWIQQYKEIYGEENIQIEEVVSPCLKCYKGSDEKQLRVWVREEAK